MNSYYQEMRNYQISESSLSTLNQNDVSIQVGHWCVEVSKTQKIPSLSQLVVVFLSCFDGSKVESNFNTMNDVIDEQSGHANIET